MIQAILAAILFGISAPISKRLLGDIDPIPLAAFLYLGSGIGVLLYKIIRRIKNIKAVENEARLGKGDIKWIAGAVAAGGIAAPIALMYSLQNTAASTASLLLNFEGAATTIIASIAFKEAIGRRIWLAVILITSASILLSWDFKGEWGISLGALGVLCACTLWGIDNNFTRNISAKDPLTIVMIKGIGAGTFSLLTAFAIRSKIPDIKIILFAMLLGCISYGLSIILFIFAMRKLGASRTSAFFGTAPFMGVLLSFLLLGELPNILFFTSLPVMILGAILILGEEHIHIHRHETLEHEHRHCHEDGHHTHIHQSGDQLEHVHIHIHEAVEHSHKHMPDIHHRHEH